VAIPRNRNDEEWVAVHVRNTAGVVLGSQVVQMAFTLGPAPTEVQAVPAGWFNYASPADPPHGWHARVMTGPGQPGGVLPEGIVWVWTRVLGTGERVWVPSPEPLYVKE
jgi:hypothetical protein